MIKSSYAKNNYGEVFRSIVDAFKPNNVVELGVLNGYSTFHIASELKRLGRGTVKAYDLFEKYPYNHSKFQDVVDFFKHCSNMEFFAMDAFEVAAIYQPNSVDLLHVDLSNDGMVVRTIMQQWDSRMVHGGVILFEGGTAERDQEEWMIKYNKLPIKTEIETNPIIQEKYIYGTYLKWPGLTMLLKKR